jgi:hypothetical protein
LAFRWAEFREAGRGQIPFHSKKRVEREEGVSEGASGQIDPAMIVRADGLRDCRVEAGNEGLATGRADTAVMANGEWPFRCSS